jgi:hypothetical protein
MEARMAVKKKAAAKAPKPTAAMMRDLYLRMSFNATHNLISEFDDIINELISGAKTDGISIERCAKVALSLVGRVGAARDALAVARKHTGV